MSGNRRRLRTALLARALALRARMYDPRGGCVDATGRPLVRAHRWRLRSYADCFRGDAGVAWAVAAAGVLEQQHPPGPTRGDAVRLFDDLLTVGALAHVTRAHSFKDARLFYRWAGADALQALLAEATARGDGTAASSSSSSSSSSSGRRAGHHRRRVSLMTPESATTLGDLRADITRLHTALEARRHGQRQAWESQERPRLAAEVASLDARGAKLREAIAKLESEGAGAAAGAGVAAAAAAADGAAGAAASSATTEQVIGAVEALQAELASVTSQADSLKQRLYFPGPDADYAVRTGAAGVYVSARKVTLEKFEAEWDIDLSRRLGAPGPQISLRLDPVEVSLSVCGLHIHGEKGAPVPSLSRATVAIDARMSVHALLDFVHSNNNNSSSNKKMKTTRTADRARGRWKATTFDVKLEEVKRSEGVFLSPSLLQWTVNTFVPARVKKVVEAQMPPELALVIGRSNYLRLSGRLSLFGVPAAVLGAPFKRGKSLSALDVDTRTHAAAANGGGGGGGGGAGGHDGKGHATETPADEAHRRALRLISVGATGELTALQGHVLEKTRRRLGVHAELKRLKSWAGCSKWTSLSAIMTYARRLRAQATGAEWAQIVQTWQRACDSFCAEDGLPPINLERIFQRALQLDKQPLEVNYTISRNEGAANASRTLDTLRTIALRALEKERESAEAKHLGRLQTAKIAAAVEKVAAAHAAGTAFLEDLRSVLRSELSVSLKGQLLSGQNDSIFDVGGDFFRAAVSPVVTGLQLPRQIDLEPSDQSMSFFAVEDDGAGRFCFDLGVPEEQVVGSRRDSTNVQVPLMVGEDAAGGEEGKTPAAAAAGPRRRAAAVASQGPGTDTEDPLFLLSVAHAPSRISAEQGHDHRGEDARSGGGGGGGGGGGEGHWRDASGRKRRRSTTVATVNRAYARNPHFPTHERLIMVTLGTADVALRVDPTKLAAALAAHGEAGADGKVDMFRVKTLPAASASPAAYQLDVSTVPGTSLHVDVEDFHVVGSPLRLAEWVSSMIHQAAEQEAAGSGVGFGGGGGDGGGDGGDDGGVADDDAASVASSQRTESAQALSAVVAALSSLGTDLKSRHLVLRFCATWNVKVAEDGKVFVRFSNSGTDEAAAEGTDGAPPAWFFQNVYFVQDVFANLAAIREAYEGQAQ